MILSTRKQGQLCSDILEYTDKLAFDDEAMSDVDYEDNEDEDDESTNIINNLDPPGKRRNVEFKVEFSKKCSAL